MAIQFLKVTSVSRYLSPTSEVMLTGFIMDFGAGKLPQRDAVGTGR